MDKSLLIDLDEPRIEDGEAFLVAGLGGRYTFATNQGIPDLWRRFAPYIGNLPHQSGAETYGVSCNADKSGSFEYIAGVKVTEFSGLPEGFATVRIGAQRYAIFRHSAHVSLLRRTHYTIWNKWLPASDLEITEGPNFERYCKDFNPTTGTGTIEVWMPVR